MNKATAMAICLVLLLSASPVGWALTYTSVKSNVSYTSVTGLEFATADQRLVYGKANPELQYGLLWLPDGNEAVEKAPLVVLIHGGCWLNEYDIQHSFPLSTALAEAGYAVWSLEYRRTGDVGGGWPGSYEDIKHGIAFTSNLEHYPVDLDRIVIAGHSAGGHLGLLVGAEFPNINGVIGLAAITDIIEYSRGLNSCQTATIKFMGGKYETRPADYHAANPVETTLHKHTVLLHGDEDGIVPPEQADVSGAKTVMAQGSGHFDWIHPGTGAYQLLLSTLADMVGK
jgi:acetyl esterase/lipase